MQITTTGFAPLSVHTVRIIAVCCNVWQIDVIIIIVKSTVLPEELYKLFFKDDETFYIHR